MKKLMVIGCLLLVFGGLSAQKRDSIPFNNTNVKIFLDSLVSGTAVDTTIKRTRTITRYSFTPSVNRWNVTDTCYNARYFLTIDVFQVVTDTPDKILTKQVADLNAEIEADQKRVADKMRARDAAVQLKSKN